MNTTLNQQRSFNLFIVAGIIIALVVVVISAIITPTTATQNAISNTSQNITEKTSNIALAPLSADAFPQYRQSELHSSSVPVTGVSGLEMYRQSERTLIPAEAGLATYHLSERTLVNPLADYQASEWTLSPIMSADLSSYYLSERTMSEAIAINDLSQYFASEHTLIDPQAGLATYLNSEQTSIPVQFTPYQISEWFGQ